MIKSPMKSQLRVSECNYEEFQKYLAILSKIQKFHHSCLSSWIYARFSFPTEVSHVRGVLEIFLTVFI